MKTTRKIKQLVRIRERILSNGDTKFYLDINQKGKKRITETLDFVYLKNPRTAEEKRQNEICREAVTQIRNKREEELLSKKYQITINLKSDTYLLVYAKYLAEERKESKGNYGNWDSMIKHLKSFLKDGDIQMGALTQDWVKSFRKHLKDKCNLKSASSFSYFNKFLALCNQAVADRIFIVNPADGVATITAVKTIRSFLTEEEVQKMVQAECRYDVLKRGFLFSILTGLRWSDIVELRWKNIDKDFEKVTIRGLQEKTKDHYSIPLNSDAVKLMGVRGVGDEKVFVGLKYSSYMNVAIVKWAANAGIQKHITFHSARHTYAYLLLKENVHIYTISKLLGHSHVKSTERYLHLLDLDRHDAVDKLPTLKFNLGKKDNEEGNEVAA